MVKMDIKNKSLEIINMGLSMLVETNQLSQDDRKQIYEEILFCLKKIRFEKPANMKNKPDIKTVFLGVKNESTNNN